MKDKLAQIFNTLKMVETKGDSTVIMADCMRSLAEIINSIPEEQKQEPATPSKEV